jgi:hypothetical protein
MAQAFVKFVDQADIDISGNQHLFYNATFAGVDVPEEIAKGAQNQLEIVKETTWNHTRIKADVTRAAIARAAELGLTVDSLNVFDASYGIERPIQADCFLRNYWVQKANHASTLIEVVGINTSAPTVVGTPTSINEDTGQYNKYTTPGTPGSPGGWKASNFIGIQRRCKAHFYYTFKTDTNLTNCRIWLEAATSYIGNVDLPTAVPGLGIRFSSVAGDLNWQLVAIDDFSGITVSGSKTPVVAETRWEMEIDTSVDDQVSYYINNLFVGVVTTNLPSVGDSLVQSATVNPTTASARAILLARFGAQSK